MRYFYSYFISIFLPVSGSSKVLMILTQLWLEVKDRLVKSKASLPVHEYAQ